MKQLLFILLICLPISLLAQTTSPVDTFEIISCEKKHFDTALITVRYNAQGASRSFIQYYKVYGTEVYLMPGLSVAIKRYWTKDERMFLTYRGKKYFCNSYR